MKKDRKCSNISVKKYQNTPRFGDRSGTLSLKNILRPEVALAFQYLDSISFFSTVKPV